MALTITGNRVVLPTGHARVVPPRALATALAHAPVVGQSEWPYGLPGTYQPDATTSGLGGADPADLTLYTGPLTINTATTLEGYRFEDLILDAAGCTFSGCAYVGPANAPSVDKGLLANVPGVQTVVKDSVFKPRAPGDHLAGLRVNGGLTLLRCDLSDVVDGVDIFGGTSTIKGCYIHDLAYYSPSATHSDNQSHSDCIQIGGGTGHVIVGNNLQGFADMTISTNELGKLGPQDQTNAALMITPDVATIGTMTITDNWLDGGQYSINAADDSSRSLGDIGEMLRNKFGRLQAQQGSGADNTKTIVLTDTCTCDTGDGTADANTYADNGDEITVRRTN